MLLLPTLSLGTLLLSLLKGLEINELFPPYWVWERERGRGRKTEEASPLCRYAGIYLERHEEEEEKEEDCPAASIPADAFETSAKKVDGKRERKKILSEIEMGTKVGQGRKGRRGGVPFFLPFNYTLPLSSSYCVRSVDSPFLLYALFLATGQDNSSVILS